MQYCSFRDQPAFTVDSLSPVHIHFRRLRDRGRIGNPFVLSMAGEVVTVLQAYGPSRTFGWVGTTGSVSHAY